MNGVEFVRTTLAYCFSGAVIKDLELI